MTTRSEELFLQHGKKYIMIVEYNELNGSWLCWIPGTGHAYAVSGEKHASKFVEDVNDAIKSGKIDIKGDYKP